MNQFTLVPEDRLVSVDGVGYNIDYTIDPSIHAVQWYGTYGEVEFKPVFNKELKQIVKPQNEIIEDYVQFQNALDAHSAETARLAEEARLAAEAAAAATQPTV